MSDQLSELLQRLQNAQQTSVQRQQEVNVAVNTALGGGLEGVRQVADALDVLRAKPADAAPYPTVPGEGALDRLLVSLAQAQVDSSNRNAHVADAVSIGDDRLTGPGDDLGTGPGDDGGIQPQVHSAVCSTCGGSGRVLTQW